MSELYVQPNSAPEQVLLVETERGQLFRVVTTGDRGWGSEYIFEWCKRDGCFYFEDVGNGRQPIPVDHDYWAAAGVEVRECSEGTRRLPALPEELERQLPGMFDPCGGYGQALQAQESSTKYCDTCDDWIPTDERSGFCPHMWYCEQGDGPSTYTDPCGCCWVCQVCREFVSHASPGWQRPQLEQERRERRERDEEDCRRCQCGAARFYAHLQGPWPHTIPGRWVQCHVEKERLETHLQWRLRWHQEERRRRAAA